MAKALELQGMSLEEVNQANAALLKRLNNLGEDVLLNTANSLWAREREEFKEDFLKRNQEFYDAKISTLDFSDPKASSIIDAWVKEKTGGKIEEIAGEIPGGAILYLINAVYFKGAWAVRFDKQHTRESDFTLLDGSIKKVPMMFASAKSFWFLKGDNFDAVGLPYGDGKLRMYVFLPHRESSLKELHKDLSVASWNEWISRFRQTELNVFMPRFSLGYEIVLNDALTSLGMGIAFDGGAADFSGMCPGGGVWIDEVKQKTFLEVNEDGTEAAAATAVKMKRGAPPTRVYVDRPFFCAISDNETGAVLFMGSIVNP
jgi:serpin B